ncbi:hypothetical protein PR202_ga02952 [Eleusine coracana subsp. coracana]|uniref:Uncharacterized protein n=1 Tax=Eleusine coracana subsp. coracana TaxID=191504 RepID=A0AAV5BMX9_ELECO|nr:hypothetical protein PR202_ga02952 [Eleusine coracana subsp. coracana]
MGRSPKFYTEIARQSARSERARIRTGARAAIKSALMTTASNMDNSREIIKDMSTGKASKPFMRGAGQWIPTGLSTRRL